MPFDPALNAEDDRSNAVEPSPNRRDPAAIASHPAGNTGNRRPNTRGLSSIPGIPPKPRTAGIKTPPAPHHFGPIEKRMWRELSAAFAFDDPASLAILRVALEAHGRSRECREAIDRDGAAIRDRWQQLKPHPLLASERDARAAFLAAMRSLNLDLASPK
jgi:phage terminase small subunit